MPPGNTAAPWVALVGMQGTTPHEGNSPCGYVLQPPDHPPPDDTTAGVGGGVGTVKTQLVLPPPSSQPLVQVNAEAAVEFETERKEKSVEPAEMFQVEGEEPGENFWMRKSSLLSTV